MSTWLRPAAVSEVGEFYLYILLPRQMWHLIPTWVGKPNFSNTKRSDRKFDGVQSVELFRRSEMINASHIIPDLASIGYRPVDAFYLDRDGGSRRVRITFKTGDVPLAPSQIESLAQLLEANVFDAMAHRTSATVHLPEHIAINLGNPYSTPGGGFEEVRVVDGEVTMAPAYTQERLSLAADQLRARAREL